MKKMILLFSILFMFTNTAYGVGPENIAAKSAILVEMETGRVLWGNDIKEPMSVASTTKIMTALLAIESGKLEEEVTISKNASIAPKVRLGIKEGEVYILKDLLYPLMLESSNDVAVAIAEHISGSVDDFAKFMNERAKEIGAENTYFVTPNGLDKDGNHSSAYDLAIITIEALKNEKFMTLINTNDYRFSEINNKRSFQVSNKNRLLKEYEGAMGVKTGFTNLAGNCFVGAAKRDEIILVSVVLASGWGNAGRQRKWTDTKNILNYGFENFTKQKVIDKTMLTEKVIVLSSWDKEVTAVIKMDGYAVIVAEEKQGLKVQTQIKTSVQAPVKKGDILGEIWIETSDGEELFRTQLIAEKDINKKTFASAVQRLINIWLNGEFRGIINSNI